MMEPLSPRRSHLAGFVLAAACLLPGAVSAAVTIHGPEAVLAGYTESQGGLLVFRSPEGETWELVTHIDDPAISNRGDGAFFPVDPVLVERAFEAVTYPLAAVDVEVFILPYPRRELLPSSAGRRALYLSPGVSPLGEQLVHALVAHELGHIVQRQTFPETDPDTWGVYRSLRGIENRAVYHDGARHRDRPREIFAEDFRFLFGGRLANYAGGIENPTLPLPTRVAGLSEFLLAVAGTAGVGPGLHPVRPLLVTPNPATGPVRLALGEDADSVFPVRVDVFDAQGRLVGTTVTAASSEVGWDPRGEDGAPLPVGLYFVRAVQHGRTWTGKLVVSR